MMTGKANDNDAPISPSDLIRWLAEARGQYSPPEGSDAEKYIQRELETAHHLADILDGKDEGWGWLPSWRWEEFSSLFAKFREGQQSAQAIRPESEPLEASEVPGEIPVSQSAPVETPKEVITEPKNRLYEDAERAVLMSFDDSPEPPMTQVLSAAGAKTSEDVARKAFWRLVAQGRIVQVSPSRVRLVS